MSQVDEGSEATHLRNLLSTHTYDLAFCFRLRSFLILSQVLSEFPLPPACSRIFVDFDDVESIALQRQLDVRADMMGIEERALLKLEVREIEAAERKALDSASAVSVCSALDADNVRRMGGTAQVVVLPNALADLPLLPERTQDSRARALFVGTMTYLPNEDAVRFFCHEILPLVEQAWNGEIEFNVVGRCPSAETEALAAPPKVIVSGVVEDLQSCYANCDFVVVPLRLGGGTRIKIIEALAYGRPVVSTSIGAEGLQLLPGRDILIGDTPAEFADACLRLMSDRTLRVKLARAGRECFERHYEAQVVRDSLIRTLKHIVDVE